MHFVNICTMNGTRESNAQTCSLGVLFDVSSRDTFSNHPISNSHQWTPLGDNLKHLPVAQTLPSPGDPLLLPASPPPPPHLRTALRTESSFSLPPLTPGSQAGALQLGSAEFSWRQRVSHPSESQRPLGVRTQSPKQRLLPGKALAGARPPLRPLAAGHGNDFTPATSADPR